MIHLLLNEYILHEIERLVSDKSMQELMINFVNGHQPSELPDSNFIDSLEPDFLSNPNLIRSQYVCCGTDEDDPACGSESTRNFPPLFSSEKGKIWQFDNIMKIYIFTVP